MPAGHAGYSNFGSKDFSAAYSRSAYHRAIVKDLITVDPRIQGGVPVFAGTRVPVKNLFDYLEGGESLDQFLDDFPSVGRDVAVAVLEQAREAVTPHAHSA